MGSEKDRNPDDYPLDSVWIRNRHLAAFSAILPSLVSLRSTLFLDLMTFPLHISQEFHSIKRHGGHSVSPPSALAPPTQQARAYNRRRPCPFR